MEKSEAASNKVKLSRIPFANPQVAWFFVLFHVYRNVGAYFGWKNPFEYLF